MKKVFKKSGLIVKVLIGLALLGATSCSNLFDDFLNEDGSIKSGDTRLTAINPGQSQLNPDENSASAGDDNKYEITEPAPAPKPQITPNAKPEEYFSSDEDFEIKNTVIDSGIVVLKSGRENYNQIIYDAAQHEYEIGYDKNEACSDGVKEARKHSSPVFLTAYDDPVTVKAFKNDSKAKITYSAFQTRTTNVSDGSWTSSYIAEGSEVFVDLQEAAQRKVDFTQAGGEGEPIVFENLPYGTTCVKITITADDAYYSDSYTVCLNKKHILTSLVTQEEGNAAKTDLTTGLVVLKESDGFNNNQISYEPSVKDYETSILTSKDNTLYLKAVPSDKKATVSWSASYTAKPVYKYEYYQTVTKTVVKVDANGKLIEGPKTTKETKKVASDSENSSNITEDTASDGSTTTTTTSTVTRKTIVGLDKMEEVTPEDISSILLPVENQNSDRVRVTSLPYGVTKVTAKVCSYDKSNPLEELYTITLPRVQFYSSEESSENTSSSGSEQSPACEDDTSKLEALSVTNLETIDDDGNKTKIETQAAVNFTFNKEETIYSLVVDEDTDVMIINPTLSENESMSNPLSKTKYSELKSNDYSVNLLGGLQVITFTVTEEGCQPRTYTIYAYKQSGNTILEAINYSSYDCVSEKWTEQSMASANYAAGLTAMSPSAVSLVNGAANSNQAKTYSLKVRADNACDVSKMKFSVKPYDSHTHIYYYVGNECPAADSSDWGSGYLANQSSNEKLFELNNDGSAALTSLWLKTVSRPYYHPADFKGTDGSSVSPGSDVTYHKIEISKPGRENAAFKELLIKTVNETGKEDQLHSDLDDAEKNGVTHTAGSIVKDIATDVDVAKIYFRLADKSDENDLKKIKFTVKNTRKSSTESASNTSFTMSPAKETEFTDGCYETINGKEYYVITLGERDFENAETALTGRTTKDLPMGETKITISSNGKTSATVILNKPDLDCHTLTAKSLIGGGSYGVNATDFYDTVYYLNKDTKSVVLSMTTKQKNEKITVKSYEKTADQNGNPATEETEKITADVKQSTEKPYTTWTSEIKNIPVGTSVVVYKVTSADGSASSDCKVTFVRAEDTETRLQKYSVTGPGNNKITGFNWADSGKTAGENSYFNNFDLKDGSGKYSIEVLPMNDNESVAVSVFGTGSEVSKLTDSHYDISSDVWSEITKTSASTFTFDVSTKYRCILVRALVTNGSYSHYYDTLITVDLETSADIKLTGKQYHNSSKSKSDSLNFPSAATNVNSSGDIQLDVQKSAKAKWLDGYPLIKAADEDITNKVRINSSSKQIVIPYSVYKNYAGNSITVTYGAMAELESVTETPSYSLDITGLETVTVYTPNNKINSYNYVLPSSSKAKQLAFRFGSQINDSSTNWIYSASGSGINTGGVDIVGSLDGGSHWGATSYNFSGLHYLVQKGDSIYLAKLEADSSDNNKAVLNKFYQLDVENKKVVDAENLGISLSVNAEVCYNGETPYLVLTASVEGADKLGVIMDTLVAPESNATAQDADSVTIKETNNGFEMEGSDYKFSVFLKNALGVDDVTRFWYGPYTGVSGLNYLSTVFSNSGSNLPANTDSAISFSWDLSGSCEKSFRVTIE